MKDLTPLLSLMLFTGIALVIIVVWRIRSRRADQEETERQREVVDRGIRAGILTPDGTGRACVVCACTGRTTVATEYIPISAASWMDKLPLLNRLFSLPPRYVIEDDVASDLALCRSHKQVAVKKLEEFHALIRAERARFNAQQEDKVAHMDGGGLMRVVEEQHKIAVRNLEVHTPLPRLVASNPRSRNIEQAEIMTLVTSPGPASIAPDDDGDDFNRANGS